MENRTASAVLQDRIEVRVGTEVYRVAPPTLSTLIRVGELSEKLDKDMLSLNKIARQAKILSEIAATIIVGESKYKKVPFWVSRIKTEEYKAILKNIRGQNYETIESILLILTTNGLDIENFTRLTIFLKEVNLIKATMIQSGQ